MRVCRGVCGRYNQILSGDASTINSIHSLRKQAAPGLCTTAYHPMGLHFRWTPYRRNADHAILADSLQE